MRITFCGATREVTGSNILIEAAGKKLLLDCGLFQGFKLSEERNYSPFIYNASEIDFVVVCHAHLDHIGRLPKLVRDGFRGKIFSTAPTKELAILVFEDSEKLMEEEAERDNHPPLYTKEDVMRVMELFEAISYEETIEISSGLKLTLKNAGHILGSAVALVEGDGVKLAYTSDLGNVPSLLLDPPAHINEADYVICESTYGGRIHEDITKRKAKLAEVINNTIAQDGTLMIPSFAIERTQELLHDIEDFCSVSGCEKPTFYLDSPLAQKVTGIFGKYPEYLSGIIRKNHKDNNFFGLERIHITNTVSESQQIETAPNPKVIIAGSGMMNGGRILHHLLNFAGEGKNSILIVGYQAQGTLGRRIFEGNREVKIYGKMVTVNAQVKTIGSYSAHADMPQLINWISQIKNVKTVFLTHGEVDQQLTLSSKIKTELNIPVVIPQMGESHNLSG